MMNVLVVGGGIGGLTAALALRRRGFGVTLVEREAAFSPVGAGIVLAPNAVAILDRLGVDTASHGERVKSMVLRSAAGRELQRVDLRPWGESHGHSYAFHRGELHEALRAGIPSDVDIRLGRSVDELGEDRGGVDVRLSDGARARYDLLVAADGIHSRTRQLAGADAVVLYSGYTCWRTVCENPGVEEGFEAWGRGCRLGAVPLRGGRLYVFLVSNAPRRAPSLEWPEGFHRVFGAFTDPCPRILAAMAKAPVMHHDLEELEAPTWGSPRVWLLGDAAHAMTPNLGQGAAMAVEDALVLAQSLDGEVAAGHERYVAARHPRVRKLQLESRRFGRVAHWQRPAAVWTRDTIVRFLPRSLGDRQFLGVVEPGLALVRSAAVGAGTPTTVSA